MLFNSLTFVVFFCVVFLVYWRLPHRAQNLFLLAASLFFYGSWNAAFLGLIIASATIDYLCAAAIARSADPRTRKRWLMLAIGASLTILGFFKYANFFVENFVELSQALGFEASRPVLNIILPVGISFHTFQSMAYTIDVYRREIEPCKRYLDFVLFVAFFPQLVAGPIERARRLLTQVMRPRPRLNVGAIVEGIKLIVVGYAQKVAIADTLAPQVDRAFADPRALDSLALLFALYAFAIQIYCDFAGYSNIARGTARLLGFELMRNFREPYLATNITEFWRRWHISLSSWLRDYLFIPLGGTRRGPRRTMVNLMITMLLGGLWHGAAWTFVVWGGLHGLYLAVHRFVRGSLGPPGSSLASSSAAAPGGRARLEPGGPRRKSWGRQFLGGIVTFHLVCLAWVFFRAESATDAFAYLAGIGRGTAALERASAVILVYVAASFALDGLLARRGARHLVRLFSRHWALETVGVTALLLVTLLVGENHVVPFIYFQF